MPRALVAVAAAVVLLLTACSALDEGGRKPTEEQVREFREVSVSGVTFEVPRGWKDLDAEEVAEGSGKTDVARDLSDRMGMTPEQFQQMLGSIDLFLFSDEGAHQGFVDNINVLSVPGKMPNDSQLKLQLLAMGAEVHDFSHQQTGLGDAVTVSYTLPIGDVEVQGAAVFAKIGRRPVSVTVSTTDRDTSEEVIERILDTLDEDS